MLQVVWGDRGQWGLLPAACKDAESSVESHSSPGGAAGIAAGIAVERAAKAAGKARPFVNRRCHQEIWGHGLWWRKTLLSRYGPYL